MLRPERPEVSIVLVHYETPLPIRLCLRSLRRYTPPERAEVIVVDNGSSGETHRWLRSLAWIRLVDRTRAPTARHQEALDAGIALASAPLICVLHSDTYVHRAGWLEALQDRLGANDLMLGCPDRVLLPASPLGAIGSWWRARRRARRWKRRGKPPKLLTHCALYRRALFDEHGLRFDHPERQGGRFIDTGEPIQRYCEQHGYGIAQVGGSWLSRWLWHFEGASLNAVRKRRLGLKRRWRSRRFWRRADVQAILADSSLDR